MPLGACAWTVDRCQSVADAHVALDALTTHKPTPHACTEVHRVPSRVPHPRQPLCGRQGPFGMHEVGSCSKACWTHHTMASSRRRGTTGSDGRPSQSRASSRVHGSDL